MSKGTLVRDNIMHMTRLFNEMEIIGVKINREIKVTIYGLRDLVSSSNSS